MKPFPCCARRHRVTGGAGIFLSVATLVLMPKCPLCVAAYLALFTGITISVSEASFLRTVVLIVCSTVLLTLALSAISKAIHITRNP